VSACQLAAFFAHPDDAELVCGGTLALEAGRGRRVALVDLTRGESGSRGTPEARDGEAQQAARILGVAHRESLGLPDARLTSTPEQRDAIAEAVRRLRPAVVILPHWRQRHPDHRAASRLVYDACFVAGLRSYRPELGAAFRPAKLVYAPSTTESDEVAASFIVDVTPVFETKLRAIRAFASQFTPAPSDVPLPFEGWQRAVETAARRHGQRIGVEYGEAFVTREPLRVDDLLSLGGRSI
jgi:bacillithiol biosynthesis deacetylase BshB1